MTALAAIGFVLAAILFVVLWQDTMRPRGLSGAAPAEEAAAGSLPHSTGSAQLEQASSGLIVALSSPDRIEANAGEVVAFPIVIDATKALPARSIVAVTALPEGATFSEGRPYGVTGWTLRADESGALQLRLPAQSGAADIRFELVAGDGTVLAQSETRLRVAASHAAVASSPAVAAPSPAVAAPSPAASDPFAAIATEPSEPVAAVETTGSVASVPAPTRKPTVTAGTDRSVKVNTVKVVAIPAPKPARPHDGGYGLGPAPEEPQAPVEWMVTKTAVDMRAKAAQSSDSVKVAEKGLKLLVTAREKNWVQVTDPKTSTTGWIYNRFLAPAEATAQ